MPEDKPNPPVTCACGANAEPCYEEVDIGVGVQRFHSGWECPEHGGLCGVCGSCGIADRPGYTHRSWCGEHPGETITVEAFEATTDAMRDEVGRPLLATRAPEAQRNEGNMMTVEQLDDFQAWWGKQCEEWASIKDEMIDAGKSPSAHDVTIEQYRRMTERGESPFAAERRIREALSG